MSTNTMTRVTVQCSSLSCSAQASRVTWYCRVTCSCHEVNKLDTNYLDPTVEGSGRVWKGPEPSRTLLHPN